MSQATEIEGGEIDSDTKYYSERENDKGRL